MSEGPTGLGFPPVDNSGLLEGLDQEWGPKMAALTDKQRRYVLASLAYPLGTATEWARLAGYGRDETGKINMWSVKNAAKHNRYGPSSDAIMEATREEAGRHLLTVGPPLGLGVLMLIARDKSHKRQLEAAIALLDRAGFAVKTEHKVTVEHVGEER